MTFKDCDDAKLRQYLDAEVVPLIPGREARIEEFGKLFGGLLIELLGFLELQSRHGFLLYEAQDLAESVFRSYIRQYAPEVEKKAAAWRTTKAKEAAEWARVDGERLQREADRIEAAKKALEEKQAEEKAKRYSDSRARQQADMEAAVARVAEENALLSRARPS